MNLSRITIIQKYENPKCKNFIDPETELPHQLKLKSLYTGNCTASFVL